jgi:hypothetical protein
LRIFYFLSDFIKQEFGDVAGYPLLETEADIERGRQLSYRVTKLQSHIMKLLNQFYEDFDRYTETNSFEEEWPDLIG